MNRAARNAATILALVLGQRLWAQGLVKVWDGDLGPGLQRAFWGHYYQTGGKFGGEDIDPIVIAPGTASYQAACVPNCTSPPYVGAQVAAGCARPERFSFRYQRSELFVGAQKLWLDPDDITGVPCGSCTGSAADVVECQMRSIPYDTEQLMDTTSSGEHIPGTGYLPASYHVALAGILAEGLTPVVSFRSPFRNPGEDPCGIESLTCVSEECLRELYDLVAGFYEYVRRNSSGQNASCEPTCDFPEKALDIIVWSLVAEPDLGRGMGFFGPWGYEDYGKQLDTLLSVPYPSGFTRRVAAPDITSAMAVDNGNGQRANWLGVVKNRVDYVTYHGLYCGPSRNYDTNYALPSVLRAELGTSQPLWCTEYMNNENLNRAGPCGGSGCSGGSPPDCGANRLVEGMLDTSKGLVYQCKSDSGLVGTLQLGIIEGHGVACGGLTGAGLIGTTTREIDGTDASKEMFLQNPSISYDAHRMILRELGGNGDPGSRMTASSSSAGMVEAARRFADGSVALAIVNDGGAKGGVTLDLSGLSSMSYPARLIQRVAAPANRDAQGSPAPLFDVLERDATISGPTVLIDLRGQSVTTLRIGPASVPFVPRILRISPAAVPTCRPGTVVVEGEGIGDGDEILVAGVRRMLRDCVGTGTVSCLLDVPARTLPLGLDREDVSVRVIRQVSGAPSEAATLTYLDPPEACALDASSSVRAPGGVIVLRGRDLSGLTRALLYFRGPCPSCDQGISSADAEAPVLCVRTVPSAACGEAPSQEARLLMPASLPPDLASLGLVLTRTDAASGVEVNGPCFPLSLLPGVSPPSRFCVEAPGAPCRIPASGTRTTLEGQGTEFTFRVTLPGPAGSLYRWDFGDGDSASTASLDITHRYGPRESLGGKTVRLTVLRPASCPEAIEIADAILLGVPDPPRILTGPGPGAFNPPRLRGFAMAEAGALPAVLDLLTYGQPRFGLEVASGEIGETALGLPMASILVGPGPGPTLGPHVRAFGWRQGGIPIAKVSFYAYGTLRYGVSPSSGAIEDATYEAILTGPGPGAVFGPHVRAFRYGGVRVEAVSGASFFAYSTLRFGVHVASAEVDLDGYDEILTGPGPSGSFGANIRSFDYDGDAVTGPALNFMAHAGGHGARVASTGARGAADSLVTAPGPGPDQDAIIRLWRHPYTSPIAGSAFQRRYGATVAGVDLDDDGSGEAIAGEGPDPSAGSSMRGFDAALAALPGVDASVYEGLALRYGCEVGGGDGMR